MTNLPNPFLPPSSQFVLDEDAFLAALGDPPPIFLADPSPDYLTATDLLPIVELLTEFR